MLLYTKRLPWKRAQLDKEETTVAMLLLQHQFPEAQGDIYMLHAVFWGIAKPSGSL
jgi:hypothetical protein